MGRVQFVVLPFSLAELANLPCGKSMVGGVLEYVAWCDFCKLSDFFSFSVGLSQFVSLFAWELVTVCYRRTVELFVEFSVCVVSRRSPCGNSLTSERPSR